MEGFCVEHAWSWNETKLIIMTSGISLGEFVLIARVVFSFPLSGPASHHQFSIEENETSYSGKVHHHHRRHTHSQDTLCHTHTKNSEYSQPEEELSKQCLSANPWHTSRLRHWCPFHVRRCMLISSSKSHTQHTSPRKGRIHHSECVRKCVPVFIPHKYEASVTWVR